MTKTIRKKQIRNKISKLGTSWNERIGLLNFQVLFYILLIKNLMEMSDPNITENKYQVAGFIKKTFDILNNSQFNKIIFWTPNGKEFIIKDISKFQQIVLPKFFRHRNINSFIRQLNMYGFHKGKKDSSKCIFSHPNFAKDKEPNLHLIKRKFKNSQFPEEITNRVSTQIIPSKVDIVVKVTPPVAAKVQPMQKISQKVYPTQVFCSPIKNGKYLISTHDLINTGPHISFLKLSRVQIHSKVSFDSDRQDCLSIEDEIQRNNSREFNNRLAGISLMNTLNFLDELGYL